MTVRRRVRLWIGRGRVVAALRYRGRRRVVIRVASARCWERRLTRLATTRGVRIVAARRGVRSLVRRLLGRWVSRRRPVSHGSIARRYLSSQGNIIININNSYRS